MSAAARIAALPQPMDVANRHRIKPMELIAIAAGVLALLLACTVLVYQIAQRKKEARWKDTDGGQAGSSGSGSGGAVGAATVSPFHGR